MVCRGKRGIEVICGRYSFFTDEENREILSIIAEVSRNYPNTPVKTGEIFPTNTAPVLVGVENQQRAQPQIWGFPHFKGSGVMINARAETVEEKRMFRESVWERRCVIPTTGFYEWKQDSTKQKYLFAYPKEEVTYLAGLYNEYKGQRRYVILTTGANRSIRDIHDRMPVVLPKERLEEWLFHKKEAVELLHQTPPMLERETV